MDKFITNVIQKYVKIRIKIILRLAEILTNHITYYLRAVSILEVYETNISEGDFMRKLYRVITVLGLAVSMSTCVFAATTHPTSKLAQKDKIFLYDLSDVGNIEDNVATIGGQLVTPDGKGIPNARVNIRLFKVNSQDAFKEIAAVITDDKGFWKVNVDLNSAKYFDSYIEGYMNGKNYVGSVEIPKTNNEEYKGWIDGSIEDMVKAGPIKTVMKQAYGVELDVQDKYGNRFYSGHDNRGNLIVATNPIFNRVKNGTMINQPKLPIYEGKEILSYPGYITQEVPIYHNIDKPETIVIAKKIILQPIAPVKTTTGKVTIGNKSIFENYWILVTDEDGWGRRYIKINRDGTFKIDNLTGNVSLRVVKVDENFKQIEAYSAIEMSLKGGEQNLEVKCDPAQYMVKLTGNVADATLHTNFGPMTLEIWQYTKDRREVLMSMVNYEDGIVLALDKQATLWLPRKGDSAPTSIKLNNTPDNPVVEYSIIDFINR